MDRNIILNHKFYIININKSRNTGLKWTGYKRKKMHNKTIPIRQNLLNYLFNISLKSVVSESNKEVPRSQV